jgi:uncharacterized protein Yka (UPF0111/DUF47 family)
MGHFRIHIIIRPISDKTITSLGFKTEYMPRAVVRLVKIFNCLAYDCIAQLNQAVERLRSNEQNMEADEILQLTSQYEMAVDKVEQESMKCKQAVALRSVE